MITVAIIAILAIIVIPQFTGETRKSKAASETAAMLGELAIRQDQFHLENARYHPCAAPCTATSASTPACPAVSSVHGTDAMSCIDAGGPWEPLRVRLSSEKLLCSYVLTAGEGAGTNDPSGFSFTSPPGSWFYIIATCDMDGDSAVDSTYFVSSQGSTIQKQNEGK